MRQAEARHGLGDLRFWAIRLWMRRLGLEEDEEEVWTRLVEMLVYGIGIWGDRES